MSRCNVCDNNVGKKYAVEHCTEILTSKYLKWIWLCDGCFDYIEKEMTKQ